MIVRGGTTVLRALANDWPALLFFLALAVSSELGYMYLPLGDTALPALPMSVLITGMSIFLAFQINQSYQRWWEGRQLWGQLVNVSRSFGREVTTLLTESRIEAIRDAEHERNLQGELVYRQLAYVNALRITLRSGGSMPESGWRDLGQLLTPEEVLRLQGVANVPTQLIQNHGRRLAGLFSKDWSEQQLLLQFDRVLNQLYDIQGGCERIKRTAFPDRFSFHTRVFVWLVAMLVPFSLLDIDQYFDITAILTETLLAFIFVTIERLGAELRDPFENKSNDTPMSALCRAIEIDLRQQLGETEVPESLKPVKGVLM